MYLGTSKEGRQQTNSQDCQHQHQTIAGICYRAQFLEEVEQRGGLPPVHRPFVAGLIVTYVFDFPHHRTYVNEDMLAQIMASPETTFDVVHEYAPASLVGC